MSEPDRHPRRILLLVTGLSPQVITETTYALTRKNWIPTEIHVITTAEGKQRVELALLSEKPGWFRRQRNDLSLPAIDFSPANIHCIDDRDGQPLESSRPGEPPPEALTEPDVNVSAHPAPPIQPAHRASANERTR